jgi:hypothetical protein
VSYPVWNGPLDKVVIPSNGTDSGLFSMPDNALGVVFFIGTLSNAATVKIQALQPKDGDKDSDVFADLFTILTGGATVTLSQVSALGSTSNATAYGFDASVLGAGVFKFVASASQSGGAVTINIGWRVDRNRH